MTGAFVVLIGACVLATVLGVTRRVGGHRRGKCRRRKESLCRGGYNGRDCSLRRDEHRRRNQCWLMNAIFVMWVPSFFAG